LKAFPENSAVLGYSAEHACPSRPSSNLEDLSIGEVVEQFDVTREQIAAVLDFVAQSLKASTPNEPSAPVDAHSL